VNLDLKRNPRNKRRDRSESGGATADPHAGHTQSLSRRDVRLPAAPRAASPAGRGVGPRAVFPAGRAPGHARHLARQHARRGAGPRADALQGVPVGTPCRALQDALQEGRAGPRDQVRAGRGAGTDLNRDRGTRCSGCRSEQGAREQGPIWCGSGKDGG